MRREVRSPRERLVDDGVLEHDAADRPRRNRFGADVESTHARHTARRSHRGRQYPDRRRLARAVRPEKAEDFTAGDIQIDATDGLDAAGPRLSQLPGGHDG